MGVNSLARSWVAALLWVVIPGLAAADLEAAFAAIDQEDYELARQELEPLAESGDPTAQYNLGVLHQGGLGTKRARKVAAGWFRKSADQGYTEAAFALGMMHGAGKGALFDPVEAYVWFWVASKKGHEAARKNLYRITRTMSVDQIIQARKLFDQRNADPSD
jgi:TPR repeat protein